MRTSATLQRFCFAGLIVASAIGQAEAEAALQPYQMVRSLQMVQDRIADGDHAAVPMQRKLLEMIDARLLGLANQDLADERNLRAVLVYAMSGGNPQTIEATLARLDLDGTDKALSIGVVNYLRGRPAAAQSVLAAADPVALPPELGAFVALIKGSVSADADPSGALRLLDQARLLGPGTLVEEAALRRSMALATTLAEPARFLRASSLYARRYLRSPYASQFADAYVAGVVALNGKLPLDAVDEITSWMTAEQRQIVYLRIARRAAIDGLKPLAEFAAARARAGGGAEDARALLYSMLGTVASETMDQALLKLEKIDRKQLSESDLELLDAVTAVAGGLTAAPPPLGDQALAFPAGAEQDSLPQPRDAASVAEEQSAGLTPVTAEHAAKPSDSQSEPPHADVPEPRAAQADPGARSDSPAQPHETTAPKQAGSVAAGNDPTDEIVQIARRKLDEVDKLLMEPAQ